MSQPPPPPPPRVPAVETVPWSRPSSRQQRTAARVALRQQRALERVIQRSGKRQSILGPLLLVLIGSALLGVEAFHLPSATVALWLGRGWPLLLVLAGMVLSAEWVLHTRSTSSGVAGLNRPRMGGGAILLLVLLVLAGVTAGTARQGLAPPQLLSRFFGDADLNLEEVLGRQSVSDFTLDAPLRPDGSLFLRAGSGTVSIIGSSEDGQVHVAVHQQIWAWHASELQRKQKLLRPTLDASADGLSLQAETPGRGQDRTDLTITVPRNSHLRIEQQKGQTSLSELRGGVDLKKEQDDVSLTALTGNVQVRLGNRNATLDAHSVTGDVTLEGRGGDLSLTNIHGAVRLTGDFYGTTHLEQIDGTVRFQSKRTTFACGKLPGQLHLQGDGALEADRAQGPVIVQTAHRDVLLRSVTGSVNVSDRSGNVTADLLEPSGISSLATTDGSLTLVWDARQPLSIEADTHDGEIQGLFQQAVTKQDDRSHLTHTAANGSPSISLRTNDGEIRITDRAEAGRSAATADNSSD